MSKRRSSGYGLAVLCLLVGTRSPDSFWADGLRYVAFAYILIELAWRAYTGVRRRQAHWTFESWHRFMTVYAVPAGALVLGVLMMLALDWRLPIVGDSRSVTRGLWASGTVILVIGGALGLLSALDRLHAGESSAPFVPPKWFSLLRKTA